MRTALSTILVTALLLAGCTNLGAHANHPPVITFVPSITSGAAPLTVTFNETAYDEDGDALTMTYTNLDVEGGRIAFNASTANCKDHPPSGVSVACWPKGPAPANITSADIEGFYRPGEYRIELQVWDGTVSVSAVVVIHVWGEPYYKTLLKANGTVTAACPLCSGGMVGREAATGGAGCQGFIEGLNQTDCVWYPLKSDWEGQEFFTNATNFADADLEMRTDCSITGKSIHVYVHEGWERREIPRGARCAVIWTYYSAPATIRFEVTPNR